MLYGEKSVCLQKGKHTLIIVSTVKTATVPNHVRISGGGPCLRRGGDLFRDLLGRGHGLRGRRHCRH